MVAGVGAAAACSGSSELARGGSALNVTVLEGLEVCDFARCMGLTGVRGDLCWRLLEFGFKDGILVVSMLVVTLMSGVEEGALVELPQNPLNGLAMRENKDFVSGEVEASVGGLSGGFWVVRKTIVASRAAFRSWSWVFCSCSCWMAASFDSSCA